MSVAASPSIAPQILIERATYGWTADLLSSHKKAVQKQIFDLQAIRQRRAVGLAVSQADNRKLRDLPTLQDDLKRLNRLRAGFVDVREHVQRRVELAGGGILFFGGARPERELPSWARVTLAGKETVGIDVDGVDDLNAMFGDPTPGQDKLLSIEYLIVGHDAERRTEAEEATTSGFEANFINQKKGRLETIVTDDPEGRGACDDFVLLGIPTIMPTVEVRVASYGHPTNPKQVWNVTSELRALATEQGGSRLHLDTDLDLFAHFGDPCPGTRKKLTVRYYVRGFHGCTRVDEGIQNHLSTDISLGYLGGADDPFGDKAPKNARQIEIDKIQKLRLVDATGASTDLGPSPYAHLGRAW